MSSAAVKCVVIERPEDVRIKEFPLPEIGPDELLMRVEICGICGTDPHIYHGTYGGGMSISFPYPVIPGHEVVGRVAYIGEEAIKFHNVNKGDRILVEATIPCHRCLMCRKGAYNHCTSQRYYGGLNISCKEPPHLWGGYAEYMYITPGSLVHKFSKDVPLEAAVMTPIIANAVRWVRYRGRVGIGDTVVILGPGAQGLSSVICAKHAGAGTIILVGLEKDRNRLSLGKEFGADYLLIADKEDVVAKVKEITGRAMADVVIECSGAPASARQVFDLAGRPEGRCVFIGLSGWQEIPLVKDIIVEKELQVTGGWGQAWGWEPAIKLIESREYLVEKMVTHKFPLEEAEQALKFAESGEGIKTAIIP